MPLTLEKIPYESVPHEELDRFADRNIHQTPAWLDFIAETQDAEPVVAEVRQNGSVVGYFTGLIVHKFGFSILGSPFPGWSTTYMGFNLQPDVSRSEALEALLEFAFNRMKYHHVEFMDRGLTVEDVERMDLEYYNFHGFEIDLTLGEDEIFHNMKHQCRNCIRKAEKSGVVVEEADDDDFAQEYYDQIKHVYEVKENTVPFGPDRIQRLIELLRPTGRLLLLRARNVDGLCIATGLFPAMNRTAFAWGQASLREYSKVRPNEAMFWHAIRYWKANGMELFDMVGSGEYKKKYGGRPIEVPWLRKSRSPRIAFLRTTAENVVRGGNRAIGKMRARLDKLKGG